MTRRIRCDIRGIVQGVGFRPFIYRLARQNDLTGWVCNSSGGVIIEAEGRDERLNHFITALRVEAPPLAVITGVETSEIPRAGDVSFAIRESTPGGRSPEISPDWDVCPDCLGELFDPTDRRYRYPFITCTNCGPRYSIITGTPYDRPLTTMAPFIMCPLCQGEYDDPADRRFHAQPNACPVCGPSLTLTDSRGEQVAGDPLNQAIRLLAEGNILAVKGTGGFHLAVDAANDRAVRELRQKKQRDEKPFALMAEGLEEIRLFALSDPLEERFITSPERPIVLIRQRDGHSLSPAVAPANGYFGVMLPSTPLQHLLLRGNFPALVMTSGNLSDEPIAFRDGDARNRLGTIAPFFLTHDRAIRTRVDDSVIRIFQGNPLFLRRSRGYAPRAVPLPAGQRNVLAVGGELKSTLCLTRGDRGFLSQHIGDLKNPETLASLEETAAQLQQILEIQPELVAHDLHPDYLSTRWARSMTGVPLVGVQHHHAHLASCMAENGLEGEVMGIIFDGTGFGPDGTVWGGELLVGGYESFWRAGHIRQVTLPGGDAAVREPYRMALSWLWEAYGPAAFELPLPFVEALSGVEKKLFTTMIRKRINSPLTSSCGRLFDGVAALLGMRSRVSYEGQAAIELEGIAEQGEERPPFSFGLDATENGCQILDFREMIRELTNAHLAGENRATLARTFHRTVARGAAELCIAIREDTGLERVVLSGGVFQNRLLAEEVNDLLLARNFNVFTHRLVPPNDGGVALGQAVIAGRSKVCA
jgi:hydrogenase maturation protein HypF